MQASDIDASAAARRRRASSRARHSGSAVPPSHKSVHQHGALSITTPALSSLSGRPRSRARQHGARAAGPLRQWSQSDGRAAAPLGQSPGRTLQRLPSPGRTLASLQPLHHTTPPTTAQSAFAPCARGREEVVPCSAATSSTRRASKSGRARTRRVQSAGARCRGRLAAPPVSARSAPRATSSCCSLTGSTVKPWTTDT